jgi:flagellar biosynthesis chaperone FliJ
LCKHIQRWLSSLNMYISRHTNKERKKKENRSEKQNRWYKAFIESEKYSL